MDGYTEKINTKQVRNKYKENKKERHSDERLHKRGRKETQKSSLQDYLKHKK
jgi:hypothetical protein